MLEIEIKDINNNPKGKIGLSEAVFNNAASESVVHTAVVSYLANQRQGTHATKTRGMVRGGGRKPWKQKKTGRARHGSIRSPIWPGGGTAFGPQPRDYSIKLPKSMRKTALYKALTMKLSDGEIEVVDSMAMEKPKTKEMLKMLGTLGLSGKKVLIVLPEKDENILLSVRNIPTVDVIRVSDLNAYCVAAFERLLFTVDAVSRLQSNIEPGTEVKAV
ncbi:MAG: 50S ribosomal protein L4 [Nitrospirae bacterium GWC2_46_6]|nr:MAG: 50S ribosomal protein L4 [Nitrospirae bacterium GWC2_46_6]OGW20676.1 MAG: 50S ribosomal protein L4 [Nitrospirae bacterium GWA2_46_11]OGW24671.1 MAG: 50S ribosomal protein L4 [Nitrospirae bacterium GWB2_47_37]HAK88106.1 50S ribosomal protein L4 [Nitrospiraceae bacterium]HCL80908.1 50S ribosomal protein L4 [Nitrospiraceae bacterium]